VPGRFLQLEAAVEIDLQILFNIGVGLFFSVGGWFFRQLWDAVAKLRADLHAIEKDLPVVYVRKEDFTEIMREIRGMFEKIHDKLDGKVDKA
jgi:hypothetical protein